MKVRILPTIGTMGVVFVAFAAIVTSSPLLLIAIFAWVVMISQMVRERRVANAWDTSVAFWRSRTQDWLVAGPVEKELALNMLAMYGQEV
jgi:hypothetical protein